MAIEEKIPKTRSEMGWAMISDSRDLIARLGFLRYSKAKGTRKKYQRKVQGLTQHYAAMVHMI